MITLFEARLYFVLLLFQLGFMIFLPQTAMFIHWCLDKEIRSTYGKPWTQEALDGQARAYFQHIMNHAILTLEACFMILVSCLGHNWMTTTFFTCGVTLLIFSLSYPYIKEGLVDPYYFKKGPFCYREFKERMVGSLCPIFFSVFSIYAKIKIGF